MFKLHYIIIFLFLYTCSSNPEYQEVIVNKTVKVFLKEYHDKAEDYTFKWEPPIGPNNEPISFELLNDMLIFSPAEEGFYKINLSITDISDEIVAQNIFYYKAIAETLGIAMINNKNDKKKSLNKTKINQKPISNPSFTIKNQNNQKKIKVNNKMKQKVHYAIQISAWPSMQEARSDQLELLDEGFDAYIERYYRKKLDEVWYRVRIGNFKDKLKAIELKKQIDQITGNNSWLDLIYIK